MFLGGRKGLAMEMEMMEMEMETEIEQTVVTMINGNASGL